jgi:bifunctional DNA-binding transcriptional regulator/antitoxin component of YhaV-PrlF toxin-antitoxin module
MVLPKALRDRARLAPGAELEVWEEGDHLVLKAVPQDDWRALAGCLSGVDLVAALEAEHAWEQERGGEVGK